MDLRSFKDKQTRRIALEKTLKISLSEIGQETKEDYDNLHCENLIGFVRLPLGVAGPLRIRGKKLKREVFIPLATTEGALIASVSRGCKVINLSGGAVVITENVGVTRGPIFEVGGIQEGEELCRFIKNNTSKLKKITAGSSSHLKLINIFTNYQGRYVYVRFSFDTDMAMGMNMATIASTEIGKYIEKKTKARLLAVAGNFDTDKKPSWLNNILGRGRKLWAEVSIERQVIKDNLHVNPEEIEKVVYEKCWGGSIMSGSMGQNAHFANITAAFFTATGQDIAHTAEAAQGVTSAKILGDGRLYFSVFLPDVLLGVLGGGTKLNTQTEARGILKVNNSDELAEALAGAVMAGELSLIASIAEGSLAMTHKKLGR